MHGTRCGRSRGSSPNRRRLPASPALRTTLRGRASASSASSPATGSRIPLPSTYEHRLDGAHQGAEMSTRFRAPATTANIGPGFDVAGAALDLWNELEL